MVNLNLRVWEVVEEVVVGMEVEDTGEVDMSVVLQSADPEIGTARNVISVTLQAEKLVISVTLPSRIPEISPAAVLLTALLIFQYEVTLLRFDLELLYELNFQNFHVLKLFKMFLM